MRKAVLGFVLCLARALPAAAQSWDDPAWYAAPPAPLDLTLTADPARGTYAVIGPQGGSFAAQGANGDTYQLTIPPGALLAETAITIWPVAAAAGLPEGAGPFSGVILEPEGLQLARTGWLEILPARPIPPAARALWGFYGTGQDARGEINWPGAGDRIVIPLTHFSGAGVSLADRIDLGLERWRQRNLEDRVRSQIAQAFREAQAAGEDGGAAEGRAIALTDRLTRTLRRGYERIAQSPAATCADIEAAARGLLGISHDRALLGLDAGEGDGGLLEMLFDRAWAVCWPEKLQICLSTGDLPLLVRFATAYERMRQLMGSGKGPAADAREAELRQGLDRCGRWELEITSQGTYDSDGGGAGSYAFSARLPVRLTFTAPGALAFEIRGEGPPAGVNVVPSYVPDYVAYKGQRVTGPMQVRVTTYDFMQDDSHRPLRLEMQVTAPGITADFVGTTFNLSIPLPVTESSWYLSHREDLQGEAYLLRRFQPRAHPVLWEMEWVGQGQEEDAVMSDGTRFRLIHIAR